MMITIYMYAFVEKKKELEFCKMWCLSCLCIAINRSKPENADSYNNDIGEVLPLFHIYYLQTQILSPNCPPNANPSEALMPMSL